MHKIKLQAIKKCPGAKPGTEFMANSVEAKALVALGFAKRLNQPAYSQSVPEAQPPAPAEPVLPPTAAEQIPPAPAAPEPLISKAVRELAEAACLNLAAIKGTGKDGRVTRGDIEAATIAKDQE